MDHFEKQTSGSGVPVLLGCLQPAHRAYNWNLVLWMGSVVIRMISETKYWEDIRGKDCITDLLRGSVAIEFDDLTSVLIGRGTDVHIHDNEGVSAIEQSCMPESNCVLNMFEAVFKAPKP